MTIAQLISNPVALASFVWILGTIVLSFRTLRIQWTP